MKIKHLTAGDVIATLSISLYAGVLDCALKRRSSEPPKLLELAFIAEFPFRFGFYLPPFPRELFSCAQIWTISPSRRVGGM